MSMFRGSKDTVTVYGKTEGSIEDKDPIKKIQVEIAALKSAIDTLADRFNKFFEAETARLREEIDRRSRFQENLLLQLVEKSKPAERTVSVDMAKYVDKKNNEATSQSPRRLPG